MISLFTYSHCRVLGRDWLLTHKSQGHTLTYELRYNEVGIKSKEFLIQVLQGLSMLPQLKLKFLAHALGLPTDERRFFEITEV